MECFDWSQVHEKIVWETFEYMNLENAMALVGILNDYQIVYSNKLRAVVEPVEKWSPQTEPALTPEYASNLLSEIYGFDPAELLHDYWENWRTLRKSPMVESLCIDLEQHRFIDRLNPISDLP